MHAKRALPISLLLLATIWNPACSSSSEPERVAEAYVKAILDGRCAEARQLLSARTNYALEYIHAHPKRQERPLPIEEYYCGDFAFEDCKLSEMELATLDGDKATVTISCGKTQDSFLPGWPSIFLKYEPRPIELIQEDSSWKVVEPYVIRMVEVREREDELREKALQERKRYEQTR